MTKYILKRPIDGLSTKVGEEFSTSLVDWETIIALLLHAGFIEKEDGPWEPKNQEEYWYISDIGVPNWSLWANDSWDNFRKKIHGIYPTREAAEAALEIIKQKIK